MLGGGAFGTVYEGRWVATPVAIKEIPVKRKDIVTKEISKEVSMHSLARHPNIVQILGYTFTKKSLWIISEMVKGADLEDILFDRETKN